MPEEYRNVSDSEFLLNTLGAVRALVIEQSKRFLAHAHRVAEVHPLEYGLYSGAAGAAYALIYLGTPDDKALARDLINLAAKRALKTPEFPCGWLTGYSGILQIICISLTDDFDKELAETGDALAERIASGFAGETRAELGSGLSGMALALESWAKMTGSSHWHNCCLQIVHSIINLQVIRETIGYWDCSPLNEMPLLGMAHGQSGVAFALELLSPKPGMESVRKAIGRARLYERQMYSPTDNNWPDFRLLGEKKRDEYRCMNAWCHGSTGIIASNCLTSAFPSYLKNPNSSAFFHAYFPKKMNLGLCHGELGNLEIARQFLSTESEWSPHFTTRQEAAITAIDSAIRRNIGEYDGFYFGNKFGLMTGLSGHLLYMKGTAFPNRGRFNEVLFPFVGLAGKFSTTMLGAYDSPRNRFLVARWRTRKAVTVLIGRPAPWFMSHQVILYRLRAPHTRQEW